MPAYINNRDSLGNTKKLALEFRTGCRIEYTVWEWPNDVSAHRGSQGGQQPIKEDSIVEKSNGSVNILIYFTLILPEYF